MKMRDGIQLSEAITGDGAAIFRHACGMDLEGIVSKHALSLCEWPNTGLAESEEPAFRAAMTGIRNARCLRQSRNWLRYISRKLQICYSLKAEMRLKRVRISECSAGRHARRFF